MGKTEDKRKGKKKKRGERYPTNLIAPNFRKNAVLFNIRLLVPLSRNYIDKAIKILQIMLNILQSSDSPVILTCVKG